MSSRLQWSTVVLLALIVTLAPWGGGGTSSTALLVLHSLALAALALSLGARDRTGPMPGAFWIGAAFVLWCALGTARAGYRYASFTMTWDVIVAAMLLWVSWRVCRQPRARQALVLAMLASATVQASWAILQGVRVWPLRAAGGFLNPNHTAAFLNLALGLGAARLVSRRGKAPWTAVSLGVILWAQLWPVASRGGLVALVLGTAGGVMVLARTPRARWAVAGAVGALALVAAVAIGARFSGPEDVYRFARIGIWQGSVQAAREHPVAGVSPGMFEHLAAQYNFPRDEGPVRYGRSFRSAHSQYLEVLVETGAVGLLLFLTAGGLLLARLRRGAGDDADGFRQGALLGLAALAIQGLVEPVLSTPAVAMGVAIVAGAALAGPGATRRLPRRLDVRVLLVAVGVGAGLYQIAVLSPWLAERHRTRMDAAPDLDSFRRALGGALRHNPFQAYFYDRAARRLLDSIDRLDPTTYTLCYNYAATAARLHPADPWLHVDLARISRRGAREVFGSAVGLQEAVEHYARATREAPTDPRPWVEMAGLLLDLQRDEDALQVAERALTIEPNFLDAHRVRLAALERLGRDASRARSDLEASLRAVDGYQPQNEYEAVIVTERSAPTARLSGTEP